MISGERVKLVRELLGLTQIEFAQRVGISQAMVAQIEKGGRQPSQEVVATISLKTGFPVSFFRQGEPPTFPSENLLFRASARMSARQRSQARSYGVLTFEVVSRLAGRLELDPVRLRRLPRDPVSGARSTRERLEIDPLEPIQRLVRRIERTGVFVVVLPVQLEGRDAFSAWVGDEHLTPTIILSGGRPGDRYRWSLAHELAHLVMHRGALGRDAELEAEADRFASELLLPEAALREEITPPVTLSSVAALKPRWGVSIQALIRRAASLGLISDRQYRYLFEQLTVRGWRLSEPENLSIPIENPRALTRMSELLYGSPIDVPSMASDMSLPVRTLRELLVAQGGKVAEHTDETAGRQSHNIRSITDTRAHRTSADR